jgi:hypothetical protein
LFLHLSAGSYVLSTRQLLCKEKLESFVLGVINTKMIEGQENKKIKANYCRFSKVPSKPKKMK